MEPLRRRVPLFRLAPRRGLQRVQMRARVWHAPRGTSRVDVFNSSRLFANARARDDVGQQHARTRAYAYAYSQLRTRCLLRANQLYRGGIIRTPFCSTTAG